MTDNPNDIVETSGDEAEVTPTVVAAVAKVNARRVRTERKPRARKAINSAAKATNAPASAPAEPKDQIMNYDATNWMNQFSTALPGADKFQTLFADASERGQQFAERSQKAAGELVELTRANVEALVETGKIAAAGAQTLGQEALARTRENFEQTAQQVRSLTQAGSPTEFFQLQSEIARTQFDRMVAEGSRFAESMVKLAGEAFQPLSTRAALSAEKINEITA
ncbi:MULTISPECIES: phasin family protein [Sphingomonas]|uniref:phasin family protein n=1 Tax=Sphingomonas TaxID=13687 RepID=UPI001269A715|nr:MULTISPECIES: phasin family protein [Sphingomonas]